MPQSASWLLMHCRVIHQPPDEWVVEHCRWEPGVAQIGGGIPFTAPRCGELGSSSPGLIGCCRSDGGNLAKLPKPCCGTSNKL